MLLDQTGGVVDRVFDRDSSRMVGNAARGACQPRQDRALQGPPRACSGCPSNASSSRLTLLPAAITGAYASTPTSNSRFRRGRCSSVVLADEISPQLLRPSRRCSRNVWERSVTVLGTAPRSRRRSSCSPKPHRARGLPAAAGRSSTPSSFPRARAARRREDDGQHPHPRACASSPYPARAGHRRRAGLGRCSHRRSRAPPAAGRRVHRPPRQGHRPQPVVRPTPCTALRALTARLPARGMAVGGERARERSARRASQASGSTRCARWRARCSAHRLVLSRGQASRRCRPRWWLISCRAPCRRWRVVETLLIATALGRAADEAEVAAPEPVAAPDDDNTGDDGPPAWSRSRNTRSPR